MRTARKNTTKLIEAAEEGMISWEAIARECLSYMSEDDVSNLTGFADFFEDEDEDEDEAFRLFLPISP